MIEKTKAREARAMNEVRLQIERIRKTPTGRRAITPDDVPRIRVGDCFDYKGRNTPTYCALYDAVVVGINERMLFLSITIDQDYIDRDKFGASRAFPWAINKTDIGKTEMLFKRRWGNHGRT